MAAGGGGRPLEETPTWAVAIVCFVLVAISVVVEYTIHLIGKWLTKRHNRVLYEALQKVKSELILLGFLSFLLAVGQGPISRICVPKKIGNSWRPRDKTSENNKYHRHEETDVDDNNQRRRLLLAYFESVGDQRRFLAAGGSDKCAEKGQVPLVSSHGIHQLHIFIFVLAVFHIGCCLITLALGKVKMKRWKAWEMETRTAEYQDSHDPERFQFARDTSFGRRHMSFWSQSPFLIWVVCFFRQFVRSVPKVDYMTLRHGFIIAHLPPQNQTNFDFQKYIKRTLEEDFKAVVGISPPIWLFAVIFLLFNTRGWRSYLWLPFIPLIIILLVGTKLQVIITRMGVRIQERGEVVKGTPVVQPVNDLFWFSRPRLILHIIHFVLFQNAFQLAFSAWARYQFGMHSCFHEDRKDDVIRTSMGILVQILSSYVALPLYALVTQRGTNMKPTIFNDRVAKALRSWHQTAREQIRKNHRSRSGTPMSSTPSTPLHHVHLLCSSTSEVESVNASLDCAIEPVQGEQDNVSWSHHSGTAQNGEREMETREHAHHLSSIPPRVHPEVDIADFSFKKLA